MVVVLAAGIVGPEIVVVDAGEQLRTAAVIREVDDSSRRVDISDEVTANNLSAVFGAGAQHERWLVDARMTIGLRNVAVVPQPAEVKTSAFSVLMGVRF